MSGADTAASSVESPASGPSSLAAKEAAVPLTHRAATGVAWGLAQAIFSKGVGILSQILLAWLLSPKDYGVIGTAYSVASFPSILRDAGLSAILLQRQKHFNRWATPAFWLSLSLGVLSSAAMLIAAPIAAMYYHEPALIGLIGVVAVNALFTSLEIVPATLLYIQLRFRLQSMIASVVVIATAAFSALMAWLRFGAYSFVVPTALVALGRLAFLWWAAGYRITWHPRLNRWRYMLGDSGLLLLNGALGMVIAMGDYLILAHFRGQDVTGVFFFAYNLSWQTLTLLTVSLGGVLFSTLAKLQADRERLTQAYLRATRVLALVGIPLCFLQAAAAEPGIRLLFQARWYPAIAIVQVLSVGMAVRVVGTTWPQLNIAQGRIALMTVFNAIACVLFVITVTIAAKFGNGLSVAFAEAIFYVVLDPIGIYMMVRRGNKPALRELLSIFAAPVLGGLFSVGIASLIAGAIPMTSKPLLIARIAVITTISLVLYAPLARWMSPQTWAELMSLRRRVTRAA